jgi:hypothetical protein
MANPATRAHLRQNGIVDFKSWQPKGKPETIAGQLCNARPVRVWDPVAARRGAAHGTAWLGTARHGTAPHGSARHGTAWHDMALHCIALRAARGIGTLPQHLEARPRP